MHSSASCDHPNFFKFLTLLQKEQDHADRSMQQILAGERQSIKRRGYVALGNRLLTLVKNYDSTHEVLDFLKGVAHNMTDDNHRWKNLKKRKNEDIDEEVPRKKTRNT